MVINMNDLISREWLLKKAQTFTQYDEGGWDMKVKAVSVEDVQAAPTVDAEPVHHASWGNCRMVHGVPMVPCTRCNHPSRFVYSYCPNCGAKMDGGAENG